MLHNTLFIGFQIYEGVADKEPFRILGAVYAATICFREKSRIIWGGSRRASICIAQAFYRSATMLHKNLKKLSCFFIVLTHSGYTSYRSQEVTAFLSSIRKCSVSDVYIYIYTFKRNNISGSNRSQSREVLGFGKLSDNSFSFSSHPLHNYSFLSVPNLSHRPSSLPHTIGSWHLLPHKKLLSVNL